MIQISQVSDSETWVSYIPLTRSRRWSRSRCPEFAFNAAVKD